MTAPIADVDKPSCNYFMTAPLCDADYLLPNRLLSLLYLMRNKEEIMHLNLMFKKRHHTDI